MFTNFIFSRSEEIDGTTTYNSRTFSHAALPNILAEFAEFLRESGFDYIENITADCGDVEFDAFDADTE